jgi:predicted GIY-YIG superfamily endonuclease
MEADSKIAFLDTLLIREKEGEIAVNWYHKPTWSGRYLNFNSWLPMSYKINTIKLLATKILSLSDTKFHTENFKLLMTTMCENGYPRRLVKDVIYSVRTKNVQQNATKKDEVKYASVPYVRNLFEKIRPLFRNYNLELVGRSSHSLEKQIFSKSKDKIAKEQKSNIIYNIECECRKVYVGQTSQYFHTRFKQHQRDGANRTETSNKSALSQHLNRTDHIISFQNAKILAMESNKTKRDILEMIRIKRTQNTLNLKTDTSLLPQSYDHLINCYC